MINYDKERKEDKSDSIINYDSLDQSQDVSEYSAPSNTVACSLITPNYFDDSDERKEERSEDTNTASEKLIEETYIIINSDYIEKIKM